MGYLLKEALKTLCGVNQWSYAVFWKIGCQNPKLLIWEECYYDSVTFGGLPGNSGIENPELGFEDWSSASAYNSHVGVRAANGLHLLVNKMMMDGHVHVLGEGLIGRAAFTGSHEWILSENYRKDSHPPEVLKEICLQFSAGLQTIAVIPILPRGVVQLGSYVPMMENVVFVNDVKSLVLQLGCVPGVMLSENYAVKEPNTKIGMPVCPGNSFTRNCIERSEVYNSTPLIVGSYNYKCNLSETVPYDSQTGCSAGQLLDASVRQASELVGGYVMSHDDKRQAKISTSGNPGPSFTSQLANIVAKAEVLSSNPEVWLSQQFSLSNPRSTFDRKTTRTSGSSVVNGSRLKFMEQQISSETGVQGHTNGSFNMSNDLMMPVLRTNADPVSSTSQDSVSFHSGNISNYGGVNNSLQSVSTFNSHPDTNLLSCKNSSSTRTWNEFHNVNSTKSEVSFSKVVDHASESNLLTSSSGAAYSSADNKFIGVDLDDIHGRLEPDLYQALNVPLSKQDVKTSLSECIPGLTPKDEKQEYGFQTLSLGDAMHGDACGQPRSGDDLFDILGVDFRNKLLNCEWNSSQRSVSDSNITYLDKNCTSLKATETSKDPYLANQGQSDNSIFSVTSTDHLLDAVISSVQPSLACGTTLTNASSLSAPDASLSCSNVGVSGQIQGDLFAFPRSLVKPGSLGSCSLGTSKDNMLHYSNSGSISRSQISSWIEQQDVRPSNSASTAYSRKTDDTSKTNRRRLKPGENPRPRPKDRQMIQDRVKELREIVPNGAKCSIDALLERTIKHMLFLQSVTKHADKLKQTGDSKIVGKEGGLLIKDNYDGGATWAYEVGSQSMVCPLIVEDLNQPRQMLVEMLCEERGLFLEIADIIRGLGLTILKGVMETRNDKIWARFAVEANRDVTRMEIFISLVRLVEQTTKNGAPLTNCIDNESLMVHQFQHGTLIPASGRPCDL